MTSRELISNLRRMGPQPLNVVLHYLADAACDVQLETGHRLCDLGDFIAWLRELGDAARIPEIRTRPRVMDRSRFDACPRCGHVHEGDKECGAEVGRGQICRCEMEVPV